jgi:hypothetical protein
MPLQFTARTRRKLAAKRQSINRREGRDRRDFSISWFLGALSVLSVLGGKGVWLKEAS